MSLSGVRPEDLLELAPHCPRTDQTFVAMVSAYCWGSRGSAGLLGDGLKTGFRTLPDTVSGGRRFVAVFVARAQQFGSLGGDTNTSRSSPTLVPGGILFADIDAGLNTSCGRTAERAVYCWGNIGDLGSLTTSTVPVPVSASRQYSRMSVGFDAVCGVSANRLFCFGSTRQLGIGADFFTTPVTLNLP